MLRAPRLIACLCAAAQIACAGGVRVDVDAPHDWSRAASWDWLPRSPELLQHADAALRARLGDAIERELAERGLARAPEPDLFVACWIALTRELVLRTEMPAQSFLPSLHASSPSYEVAASQRRWLRYESAELAIEVFEARTRRLLWRARIEQRVRGSFAERSNAAVAELLEAFPAPAPRWLSARREPASAAAGPGTLP